MESFVRSVAKKVLPHRLIRWYRRRRAVRRYLRALGNELYDRQARIGLQDTEQRAAVHGSIYGHIVDDILKRTDLILQELDRRIEGVSARHGGELQALRREVGELRAVIERDPAGQPRVAVGSSPVPGDRPA